MKFTKDGYDYISTCGKYVVGKYFDMWAVWFNDEKIYLTDTFKDAKEYCDKHSKGIEKEYKYVV